MKHIYLLLLIILLLASSVISEAEELTCEEIIKKVDANTSFTTTYMEARMIVHTTKRVDEKQLKIWAMGNEKSYSEVLAPEREAGTKYLKIDEDLWMWLPSAEKIIRISGHMLRQSMLGSDMSYEDSMERNSILLDKYSCELLDEEIILERDCYVLELTATDREVTYYRRKMWVDKERFISLREELYAKSGKLLKEMEIIEVKKIDKRWYPVNIVMRNKLRKNSYTEFILDEIEFDIELDEDIFSQRHLERE